MKNLISFTETEKQEDREKRSKLRKRTFVVWLKQRGTSTDHFIRVGARTWMEAQELVEAMDNVMESYFINDCFLLSDFVKFYPHMRGQV